MLRYVYGMSLKIKPVSNKSVQAGLSGYFGRIRGWLVDRIPEDQRRLLELWRDDPETMASIRADANSIRLLDNEHTRARFAEASMKVVRSLLNTQERQRTNQKSDNVFAFTEETMKELNRLASREGTSLENIVARAIEMESFLLDQRRAGNRFVVADERLNPIFEVEIDT